MKKLPALSVFEQQVIATEDYQYSPSSPQGTQALLLILCLDPDLLIPTMSNASGFRPYPTPDLSLNYYIFFSHIYLEFQGGNLILFSVSTCFDHYIILLYSFVLAKIKSHKQVNKQQEVRLFLIFLEHDRMIRRWICSRSRIKTQCFLWSRYGTGK